MNTLKSKNIILTNYVKNNIEICNLICDYITSYDYHFPVIITTTNNMKLIVKLMNTDNENAYFEVCKYNNASISNKKNKYIKETYKQNKKLNDIKVIGLNSAKQLHAIDVITYNYIPLKEFLNKNKEAFSKTELYFKDNNDQYNVLRHKNLFSEYVDEISDFERLTFIERDDNKILKIRSSNDNKILEYDYLSSDLLQRKFAREFAKLIYNYKSGFKDKELLDFLKDQAIYIKVETTISGDNKIVWDKITPVEMKSNVLSSEVKEVYKKRKNKKDKYYISKRNKRHKIRRNNKKILYNEMINL